MVDSRTLGLERGGGDGDFDGLACGIEDLAGRGFRRVTGRRKGDGLAEGVLAGDSLLAGEQAFDEGDEFGGEGELAVGGLPAGGENAEGALAEGSFKEEGVVVIEVGENADGGGGVGGEIDAAVLPEMDFGKVAEAGIGEGGDESARGVDMVDEGKACCGGFVDFEIAAGEAAERGGFGGGFEDPGGCVPPASIYKGGAWRGRRRKGAR